MHLGAPPARTACSSTMLAIPICIPQRGMSSPKPPDRAISSGKPRILIRIFFDQKREETNETSLSHGPHQIAQLQIISAHQKQISCPWTPLTSVFPGKGMMPPQGGNNRQQDHDRPRICSMTCILMKQHVMNMLCVNDMNYHEPT